MKELKELEKDPTLVKLIKRMKKKIAEDVETDEFCDLLFDYRHVRATNQKLVSKKYNAILKHVTNLILKNIITQGK